MASKISKIILSSSMLLLLCSCGEPPKGGFDYSELPSEEEQIGIDAYFDPARFALNEDAKNLIASYETGVLTLTDEDVEKLLVAVSKNEFYPNKKTLAVEEFDKYERGKKEGSPELEYYDKNYNHVTNNVVKRNKDYTISGELNYSPYVTNVRKTNTNNEVIGHQLLDYSTTGTFNISYDITGAIAQAKIETKYKNPNERFVDSVKYSPVNEEFKIEYIRLVDLRTYYSQMKALASHEYWDEPGKLVFTKNENGDLVISFNGKITTEVQKEQDAAVLTNVTAAKTSLTINKDGYVSEYIYSPKTVKTYLSSDKDAVKNKIYEKQYIKYTFAHEEVVVE